MTLHTKHKSQQGGLGQVISRLRETINVRGSDFADAGTTKSMVSLESMEAEEFGNFNHVFTSMEGELADVFGDSLGEHAAELTPAQKAAGSITALAAGDPKRYAQAAISGLTQVSTESHRVVEPQLAGIGGDLDYRDQPSMEAFDEQELRAHLPFSIAFNVQAARQDEFSEAFYPTIVVTPDQAGVDIVVRRITVMNEIRHSLAGDQGDFDKRNIIDAVIDHRILASESVRAVPVYSDTGTDNSGKFVSEFSGGVYAPATYTIDQHDFDTAPLAVGQEVNLLGLSTHPGLAAAGVLDNTDALDKRIHLENLYLRLNQDPDGADDIAGNADDVANTIIPLKVDRLPRSAFIRPPQGNHREMILDFITDMVTIDENTTDYAGNTLSGAGGALEVMSTTFAGLKVRLKITANGRVNVETGQLEVHINNLEVHSIVDADGVPVADQATKINTFNDTFPIFNIVGYDLFATRSNANRRVRGLLVDTTEEVERHTVQMGSPITVLSPVVQQDETSQLTSAIAAARIRNSNNAVTTMLNYFGTLDGLALSNDRTTDIQQIEGAGRWLVRPFFEKVTLDLVDVVNSVKSHERSADISAALVDTIREVAYRMYRDSGYQPALDAMTGGVDEKPTLVIGTDPELAKHLIVQGDTRLGGLVLPHKVVTSYDKRVYGKIFISLVREGQNGPDPLSFGTHVWIPELASTVQVSRAGSTVKEAQVQPRNRHINNLPVGAQIDVSGLKDILTTKTSQPVRDV